jgi:hypothetical protein
MSWEETYKKLEVKVENTLENRLKIQKMIEVYPVKIKVKMLAFNADMHIGSTPPIVNYYDGWISEIDIETGLIEWSNLDIHHLPVKINLIEYFDKVEPGNKVKVKYENGVIQEKIILFEDESIKIQENIRKLSELVKANQAKLAKEYEKNNKCKLEFNEVLFGSPLYHAVINKHINDECVCELNMSYLQKFKLTILNIIL